MSKFGVQIGGVGGILQPKLSYRFRVNFFTFGIDADLNILSQNVQTCTRPKFTQAEITVHSYNSRVYLGGKTEWNAIDIEFRDDITNGSIAAIGQQLQKQYNFFEQTSAIAGNDYKFRMEIESLDGTHGTPLDVWNVEGCWVTNLETPNGDYASTDGFNTVKMTVRYDNAAHLAGGSSNVATIGGDPFTTDVAVIAGNLGNSLGGFFSN